VKTDVEAAKAGTNESATKNRPTRSGLGFMVFLPGLIGGV